MTGTGQILEVNACGRDVTKYKRWEVPGLVLGGGCSMVPMSRVFPGDEDGEGRSDGGEKVDRPLGECCVKLFYDPERDRKASQRCTRQGVVP